MALGVDPLAVDYEPSGMASILRMEMHMLFHN